MELAVTTLSGVTDSSFTRSTDSVLELVGAAPVNSDHTAADHASSDTQCHNCYHISLLQKGVLQANKLNNG
jgi:hypothetical protein